MQRSHQSAPASGAGACQNDLAGIGGAVAVQAVERAAGHPFVGCDCVFGGREAGRFGQDPVVGGDEGPVLGEGVVEEPAGDRSTAACYLCWFLALRLFCCFFSSYFFALVFFDGGF